MTIGKMNRLVIGDLTARIPIIQGGMGVGISLSGLASAVANEGGIGVIAAAGIGMLESDQPKNYLKASMSNLKNEIRKARKLCKNGIIGVNIMVALSNYSDLVKTSIDEGIDIIFSGAGLPLKLPEYLSKVKNTKLVPIVSSARAAKIICKKWVEKYQYLPDAIIVEGPKAGGHLGFKENQIFDPNYSIDKILIEVILEIKAYEQKYDKSIPVIAAGGIYSGEDIHKYIKLGASGVQMATRFVTTVECDASVEFKEAFVASKKEDIVLIKSPVGMPGRALRNSFTNDIEQGLNKPFKCPYHCIVTCNFKETPYCIAAALTNAQKGELEKGFVFAGENAYRTNEIITVKKLMEKIQSEYSRAEIQSSQNY